MGEDCGEGAARVVWAFERYAHCSSALPMPSAFDQVLHEHRLRPEALLARSFRARGEIDPETYAEFRVALLRRLAIEQDVLIPAATRLRRGKALPTQAQLHLDNLALTALLVPPPTLIIVTAIRAILAAHDARETGPGGLYDLCAGLADEDADALLTRLHAMPDPAAPRQARGRGVMQSIRRALARAGYDLRNYE